MSSHAPGIVEFHRPARVFPTPVDQSPISIASPPSVPTTSPGSILQIFLPMVGSASMIGFAILYRNQIFMYIAIGIAVLLLTVGIAMRVQSKRQVKRQRRQNAQKYRTYLAELRSRLEDLISIQDANLMRLHPGVDGVWSLVNDGRYVWERRPDDPDFMLVRLGLGAVPLAAPIRLELSGDPLVEYEPDLLEEAQELFDKFKELPLAPVTLSAVGLGTLAVIGEPEASRSWVRTVLCTIAALHAPDDVRIVSYFPQADKEMWSWLKWLPHARGSIEQLDEARQSVALAVDVSDFEVLLSQLVKPRIDYVERQRAERQGDRQVRFQQTVVVVDDLTPSGATQISLFEEMLRRAPEIGIVPIVLVSDPDQVPTTVGARVEISPGGWLDFIEAAPDGRREQGLRADSAGIEICEALARALAPLRLKSREGRAHQVDSEGLLDLLHLSGPPAITPERWQKGINQLLRTPIGVGEDGSQIVLDLKESAEAGMGPHGLVVGATGSGKSELLRTLVCGLAAEHSPDDLAMVLVDFKGGATFAELARLPHAAGMITNIERDLTLVDRMHEALFGELERRQRVLQEMGNFDRVRDYQEYRRDHSEAQLPPLPSLLVIIDEFGELLANRPDFIDLFVSIGRTGRSLGVHLLLATQRIEAGRLRGLESHLRYRICLRTFSSEESLAVLGVRDAYELPPLPGLGYMSVDGGLQQFKAALSTRPYREYRDIDVETAPQVVRAFSVSPAEADLAVVGKHAKELMAEGDVAETEPVGEPRLRSELQVVVDRLEELVPAEQRVRQVWLPPLPHVMSLDEVVDPDKRENRSPDDPGWLEVVVGLRDRPREQMQLPMTLRFTGREGHCAIVGAPRSGKSALLQTLVASLSLTHDPSDVQVYALDFGGGALNALETLPHVGAVYSRSERAEVNRLVREMRAIMDNRTELFRLHHISAMPEFHAKRRAGEVDDGYGEVFLLIDNWALLSQEFEDLHQHLVDMAGSCLHYGIHFVITSNRWMDMRMNLRDNIGGRVELRLNDPLDSEIDRKVAKTLPDVPGRGIGRSADHFQVSLPRIDGRSDISGLNAGIGALVDVASERWSDSRAAPPIRMLPFQLTRADLGAAAAGSQGIVIGIEEFRLEPVTIDLLGGDSHLLVYGDGESGKTNLLKVLFDGVRRASGPKEVKVAIVDYRRKLLEFVGGAEHVVAYAYTADMASQLANEISNELRRRMPSTPESLTSPMTTKEWTGPRIVLLVDDFDLVATPSGNPLGPLTDLLAQSRDVGFHVVLTRRVSGTARGSFEPFYQRLVELGSPGLVMNGDPQEGAILGGQKAEPLASGRGYLVANRRSVLIQTILAADGESI